MDTQNPDNSGTSRRGLLKCMAWAGTGMVWTVAGGIPRGLGLGEAFAARSGRTASPSSRSATAISASTRRPTPTRTATLQAALDRITKLPKPPAMVLHTGDVTHLSKPEEFDTAAQILKAREAGHSLRARRARRASATTASSSSSGSRQS